MAQVAQAVVAELNGHTFSTPLAAVRSYYPIYKREEMDTLHVTVVPAGSDYSLSDRSTIGRDFVVDISVQKAVSPTDLVAVDALVALVEEVADFFLGRRLSALVCGICPHVAMAPGSERGYIEEHMETLSLFTGVIQVTVRVVE
jgi:hypothetical protein